MRSRGKLISISGIDGSGKTSIITRINSELQELSILPVISYDPHPGLKASSVVRGLIKTTGLPSKVALGLITSVRVEALKEIILPALERGRVVITHRFVLDSMAYQDRKTAIELHKLLCDDIQPDLQLILDAPSEVCKERIKDRDTNEVEDDIFDNADISLFEERRQAFMWQLFTKNTHVIDANKSKDEVFKSCWHFIFPIIEYMTKDGENHWYD